MINENIYPVMVCQWNAWSVWKNAGIMPRHSSQRSRHSTVQLSFCHFPLFNCHSVTLKKRAYPKNQHPLCLVSLKLVFFSNRFCVWILHSTELRTYFPSLVGWFMTRVFTTSAGVPISAATRPEHTLQKQGNLTMIACDGHSTKVHCQCILARSDQYHDCPFPTSQCTPKLQCSCPNSSFIQVKQERQVKE